LCCGGPEDKEEFVPVKLFKTVVEAPPTQRFLHCEYTPFPGDSQPVQTDIVLYGQLAAKIFTDQLEPKVVQVWSCDDITWVSWTNWQVIYVHFSHCSFSSCLLLAIFYDVFRIR